MRRVGQESGMTIVEVLVAGMILVLGALGVLGIVDAASHNTFRAEQSQAVANVLQREMEKLRQLPYKELALEERPEHAGDPENPNSRIASTSFFYTGRNETGLKPLVYNGATNGTETIKEGAVDSGPIPFQVGRVRGDVYRYVVWDTCPSSLCQDGRHLKRAVVVATIEKTASGGTRRYQEIQSQFVDPKAEPSSFPSQEPGGSSSKPWTLWLTDTPCSELEWKEPPKTEGSHPTHNTRGDCEDGPQGGDVPGAPDLLWPATTEEEGKDHEYDYATDVEPVEGGSADEGLQILPGAECGSSEATQLAGGVATDPDPHPEAFKEVHRWLSPPLGGTEDLLLTGEGTLDLRTQTWGGVPYPGRICAWIFVRSYSGGKATDTFAVNLGPPISLDFSYFAQSWPSDKGSEISIPLSFGYASEGGALPLHPGSRFGLALSVGADSSSALQLLYDTPSFDSRIQLATAGAPPPEA